MAKSILPHISPQSVAAFNARVVRQDGCWGWNGAIDGSGYARLSISKNMKLGAHRFAYAMFYKTDPGELCVCHHCDNPICTNPSHLFLGTHKDNADDKVKKGRQAFLRNESNPMALLTEEAIENIRLASAAWMSNIELGNLYGVHHSTISAIRKEKIWHKIGTPEILAEFTSHAVR